MTNKVYRLRKIENIDEYLKAFNVLEFVKSIKITPRTWFRSRPGKDDWWGINLELENNIDDFDPYILVCHNTFINKRLVSVRSESGWASGRTVAKEMEENGMHIEWAKAILNYAEIAHEILSNYNSRLHKYTLESIKNLSDECIELVSKLLFTKVFNVCTKKVEKCKCKSGHGPHYLIEFIREIKIFSDGSSIIQFENKVYKQENTHVTNQQENDYFVMDKTQTNELIFNFFNYETFLKGVRVSNYQFQDLKGGVLIIGSLFWQNYRDEEGDDIRKNWRDIHLKILESIDVSVPIRYGRFSGSDEKGGQVYTMIFDNKLHANQFGRAKVVPFKKKPICWDDLRREVIELSNAEGLGKQFLKGDNNWGACCIVLNPRLDISRKKLILNDWKVELRKYPTSYSIFVIDHSVFSATNQGELLIDWPIEAEDFDYLIATSTRPQNRGNNIPITPEEIAKYVNNRRCFFENINNGIGTYQDVEIKRHIKE